MTSVKYYRRQAESLRELAKATTDLDEGFVYLLRAIEFDTKAEDLEQGQVQQRGNQPPPAPPRHESQPAQQQQQVQPKKEGD
jgi:hypothetical protein